jgi:Kef-type K+ transport system membrane component KefB
MTASTLTSLLVLALAATLAPLLVDLLGRWVAIPLVVVEIAMGVLIGPNALGWVRADDVVSLLASLGLSMLMFFAGFEINFAQMRGRTGNRALQTWLVSLVVGMGAGTALHLSGFQDSGLVLGLALTTTALGTLVPILKDSGAADSPLGTHVMANGAVGEFGPVLAVSVLFSTRAPARTGLVLLAFAAVAVGAVLLARRTRPAWLSRMVTGTLRTSGQLVVRGTLLLLVGLVWVASEFGLDVLLGAFTAGVVMRLFVASGDRAETEVVADKLEAVGFGFLIPLFFIVTGVRFDLAGLFGDATALALLPVFLVLFLLVRGVPVLLLYRSMLPSAQLRSLALFASTALPMVVAITSIGVQTGKLEEDLAAALVGAAMISVAVFPLAALTLYRRSATLDPAVP